MEHKSYSELKELIDRMTDPNGELDTMVATLLTGDPILQGIAQLRAGLDSILVEPEDVSSEHGCVYVEEVEESRTLLRMAEDRVISMYASYVYKVQECRCMKCRAADAHLN